MFSQHKTLDPVTLCSVSELANPATLDTTSFQTGKITANKIENKDLVYEPASPRTLNVSSGTELRDAGVVSETLPQTVSPLYSFTSQPKPGDKPSPVTLNKTINVNEHEETVHVTSYETFGAVLPLVSVPPQLVHFVTVKSAALVTASELISPVPAPVPLPCEARTQLVSASASVPWDGTPRIQPLLVPWVRAAETTPSPVPIPVPRVGVAGTQPLPAPTPVPWLKAARSQFVPAPISIPWVGMTGVSQSWLPYLLPAGELLCTCHSHQWSLLRALHSPSSSVLFLL